MTAQEPGIGNDERPFSNVSDTARWVAVYRADESARPDAVFRDPWPTAAYRHGITPIKPLSSV